LEVNIIKAVFLLFSIHEYFSFSHIDSPKNLRNKGPKAGKGRTAVNLRRQSTSATAGRKATTAAATTSGTMVVVNKGNIKEQSGGVERDSDILRLQVSEVVVDDGN
jgi:hypothetical protein